MQMSMSLHTDAPADVTPTSYLLYLTEQLKEAISVASNPLVSNGTAAHARRQCTTWARLVYREFFWLDTRANAMHADPLPDPYRRVPEWRL